MPRTIDHDRRRADLLAAVWRVVLRAGVGAATVRKVAAEAGLSPGSVRYFFADQRELLYAAMREVVRRAEARIRAGEPARLAGGIAHGVFELLAETLPLDKDRLTEARVWFAFTAHDAADDTVRAIRRELDGQVRQLAEHGVASLAGAGLLGAGRDADTEVTVLLAVLDGLTLRLLLNPETLSAAAAEAALRAHLANLALPVST